MSKLKNLRLYGFAQGLNEQQESGDYENCSFEERLGYLIDREETQRQNNRLKRRLSKANLRQSASLEELKHSPKRGLDPSLINSLHNCKWIKEGRNILVTGATGVGKSYLACAFAHRACLSGYSSRYFGASKLFETLNVAMGEGKYVKLSNELSKSELLVIDDFGLIPFGDQERRYLFEIMEDRTGKKSVIIASQLPIERWYDIIGDPTLADAILDRMVHNAYRINLKGESMRKKL